MANTLPGTPYVESSDLVANYPAVSESLAERVDLVGILPFASSTARGTALPTPTDGQFSYLQDSNSTEFWNGSAWQALSSGKILQVVRATDTTNRTTTSTSFVDVTGMSVTITPARSTSNLIIIASFVVDAYVGAETNGRFRITTSANVALSGAEAVEMGNRNGPTSFESRATMLIMGYVAATDTTSRTYKLQFQSQYTSSTTVRVKNADSTGQMYAIEVAA